MKKKIRRRCKGGCGGITSPGKKYINGHTWEGMKFSEEHKKNMRKPKSEEHKKNMRKPRSEEAKKNMSLAQMGKKQSEETKLNQSIRLIKYDPDYEYGCEWQDKEYRKDLRKDHCENVNCKNSYKRLCNHHIHLDKKKCAPNDIMTLCNSCHSWLHNILQNGKRTKCNPKDYIIINRLDHVSYIHKPTRKIIRIERVEK